MSEVDSFRKYREKVERQRPDQNASFVVKSFVTRRFKMMSWSNDAETSSSSSAEWTAVDETAATCLMLLSKVGESNEKSFECKTCGKTFSTFQALGGHRASHKKPKLDHDNMSSTLQSILAKPRSHKCSICGAEFELGQALGGHMRRHKDSKLELAPVLVSSSNKRVCLDLNLNLMPPGEMKMQSGRLQEYDLRMQMAKRRRIGDEFHELVAL